MGALDRRGSTHAEVRDDTQDEQPERKMPPEEMREQRARVIAHLVAQFGFSANAFENDPSPAEPYGKKAREAKSSESTAGDFELSFPVRRPSRP